MTNKEILIKKITYRSEHRGTKEMDILLGNFVNSHIDLLNIKDLIDLSKLLSFEDEILYKWYFEKNQNNQIPVNRVTILLKNFKL